MYRLSVTGIGPSYLRSSSYVDVFWLVSVVDYRGRICGIRSYNGSRENMKPYENRQTGEERREGYPRK